MTELELIEDKLNCLSQYMDSYINTLHDNAILNFTHNLPNINHLSFYSWYLIKKWKEGMAESAMQGSWSMGQDENGVKYRSDKPIINEGIINTTRPNAFFLF